MKWMKYIQETLDLPGMRREYKLDLACVSDRGRQRENNEDNFYFCGEYLPRVHESVAVRSRMRIGTAQARTVAVFDGMGGLAAGEAASYAAADALGDILKRDMPGGKQAGTYVSRERKAAYRYGRWDEKKLKLILEHTNTAVCRVRRTEGYDLIGTTAVLLTFYQDRAWLGNLGDSRAFLYRDGRMQQISEDHTDTHFDESVHPAGQKPGLTQFLGMPKDKISPEPYTDGIRLAAGDVYLICSDGLTDLVSEEAIAAVLDAQGVREGAGMLLQMALSAGGRDNITLILAKVSSPDEI